jgi:hypothetical protein
LLRLRLTGQNPQFIRTLFLAQLATPVAWKQKKFGLIDDRPFSPKTTAANGKSFISVAVAPFGGHGVAIVPYQI